TPGSPLEQAIGEAARRGSDVERRDSANLDAERFERPVELLAASSDEAGGRRHGDGRIAGDQRSGLVDAAACGADEPRQDEGLGLLARRGEPALDEEEVDALAVSRWHGGAHALRLTTYSARAARGRARSP